MVRRSHPHRSPVRNHRYPLRRHPHPRPPPNVWHHFVGTFRQNTAETVQLTLFLNGRRQHAKALAGRLDRSLNPGPLLIGSTFPEFEGFNGLLDEVTLYRRALSAAEVAELHGIGPLGKALPPFEPLTFYAIDGQNVTATISDPDWTPESITFLAETDATRLDLVAGRSGALFDSFELAELPATFFLPEEPFQPIIGQPALGDWKLEVTDRRVGATNLISPELISWHLDLTFAPPLIPAVRLTNAVPYTNIIGPNQAAYFFVEVPRSATMATNRLTAANGLDLWFHQSGLPTFNTRAGNILLFTNQTDGLAVIGTSGTRHFDTNDTLVATNPDPTLIPGQRYYLALTNRTVATDFVLEVTFDALDTNVLGLIDLPFNTTIQTNIAATNVMQFYRYTVTTNATAASFELLPDNGNVDLYIRRAQPVPDPLPTPARHDYASENPGTLPDIIRVTRTSPIPLTPGDWYLGVLNVDTQPVDYSIRVVETADDPVQIIDLTPGVTLSETAEPGSPITRFFRLTLTNNVPAAQFDLFNVSGPVTLVVRQDARPSAVEYDFLDLAAPAAPARLLLLTNNLLPSLTGEWFLAALPAGASPVSFSIQASLPDPTPVIHPLTASVPVIRTIPADMPDPTAQPRPDYYRFNVRPEAVRATFTLTPNNGNADLLLRRGLPLPDFTNFDYFSGNLGLEPDILVISTNSLPVPIAPGDWYLAVINQTSTSVTYRIRADEQLEGEHPPVNISPELIVRPEGVTLRWIAEPGLRFQLQYAIGIPTDGPILWITVPGEITSLDGTYSFLDDGSQTGGDLPFKLYRLLLIE